MRPFAFLALSSIVLLQAGLASAEVLPETAAAKSASGVELAPAQAEEHAADEAWRLQASYDLGVLSFGGLGVHAGAAKGPWAAQAGFYRFESKNLFGGALGGFGDEFTLHVDFIVAAQVGYFFNGETNDGWYGKVIYQVKQQTVTHEASGDERALISHLVGPEVGYEWDIWGGIFLRPRLGVLYYAKAPQPGREPVLVGGAEYDNSAHTWVDAYITADLGFEFDL